MNSKEERYVQYLNAPLTPQERADVENHKSAFIQSGAFDGELAFGTGGVREVVAHGTNRLNIYNIARLSAGLAKTVKNRFPEKTVSAKEGAKIIIAADSRLSSKLFSTVTYFILKNAGFDVTLFQRPTPTPLLSFAVRHCGALAGVVITASHNPPEYNGFKVYWNDGGQIVSPLDKEIEHAFHASPYAEIPNDIHTFANSPVPAGDITEESVFNDYIEALKREPFLDVNAQKPISILYSPLHGTGGWFFERLFEKLNFSGFRVLKEQAEPDGNFPTVKLPNPEEESSFDLLKKEGLKTKTKLLLASDPDADRIGCAVLNEAGDHYDFLTGNQIGALLMDHLLNMNQKIEQKNGHDGKERYVCKTIVTSPLQNKIAQSYNVRVKETLTGFKYIADEIQKDPENYIFGGEESFGYLPIAWVRDKDSLSSGAALAQLAQEIDLPKKLALLYLTHGLHSDFLYSIKLSKPSIMENILEKLRSPQNLLGDSIGDRKIVDILDLQKTGQTPQTGYYRNLKNTLEPSTVVQFMLEPEGRMTIRPSGTEPKVKVYLNLIHPQKPDLQNLESMKKELAAEAKKIQTEFFKRLELDTNQE